MRYLLSTAADFLGGVADKQRFAEDAHEHEEQMQQLGCAWLHVFYIERQGAQSGGGAHKLIETGYRQGLRHGVQ